MGLSFCLANGYGSPTSSQTAPSDFTKSWSRLLIGMHGIQATDEPA